MKQFKLPNPLAPKVISEAQKKSYTDLLIYIFAILWLISYILVNVFTLELFPLMHSDESWLSGLTRSIFSIDHSSSTEYFFDLYPRYPHAIKFLFHGLQQVSIKLFGYSLFSIRFLSLILLMFSLFMFYKVLQVFSFSIRHMPILGSILFGSDIQIIYAGHFGRQEILLCALLLVSTYVYHNMLRATEKTYGYSIILGVLTGCAWWIHPNALLITGCFFVWFLFDLLITKMISKSDFLIWFGIHVLCIISVIVMSLYMDRSFFTHYINYGKTLGVQDVFGTKISRFPLFIYKLFKQISGTYYTPPIHIQSVIFLSSMSMSIYILVKQCIKKIVRRTGKTIRIKKASSDFQALQRVTLGILTMVFCLILIGRYGQPSIVLFFPFSWLLFFLLCSYIEKHVFSNLKCVKIILLALIISISSISLLEIKSISQTEDTYRAYVTWLQTEIPENTSDKILGNLNTEFAFTENRFVDWRNLSYLSSKGISLEEYLEAKNIAYIIYTDEIDYVYENRPLWNSLYGNTAGYYQDLKHILQNSILVSTYSSNNYACRISLLQNTRNWTAYIYTIK